jgi:Raf kinase inhibitor-like YbhB/YbcL family protein
VNGAVKSGPNTFGIGIFAGGTSTYVLSGDAVVRRGYLVILADRNGSEQGVSFTFYYHLRGAKGELVDSTGVPVLQPATHFVFPAERTASAATAFAWAPLCIKTGFNIRLQLFNETGTLKQTVNRTFDGQNAEFLDEAFNSAGYTVPTHFGGRVEVQSQELLYVTVLRLETPPGSVQLTSTPPEIPLVIDSIAFDNRETIPEEFGCRGQSVSPPLNWSGYAPGVLSWALIVEDPDAPEGVFIHWVLFNIPAAVRSIDRGAVPTGSRQGRNGFGTLGYGPLCPPQDRHRYFFKLYALDATLSLAAGATAVQLREAMTGHILSTAQFLGYY